MKTSFQLLMVLFAAVVQSANGTASVNVTNNTPGVILSVSMYTVVDNAQYGGVTTFSCDHFLHYGQTLFFQDSPPVSYYLTGILTIPAPPMDDGNYNWNWEELPGYPVGRVWDGVTIDSDFPAWGWSNWPNNWFMVSPDDIDNHLAWGFAGSYPAVAITVEAATEWEKAEELRKLQRLQKLGKVVQVSKRAALTLPLSMLLAVWLQGEMERVDRQRMWSYVVYEKVKPSTGQVYTGKTSGPGDPASVLGRRNAQHHILNSIGFQDPVISAATATRGKSSWGSALVRGREQQVMDYHGGALSDREYNPSRPGDSGRTRAVNLIRSVAKNNPLGQVFWRTSTDWTGFVYKYTGDPQVWNMTFPLENVILLPPISAPPQFFPN